MPIATPEIYAQMLDTAKQRGYAFPSINVTSSQTLNAALRGFADASSDGIIQISTGGAEYLSGSAVKDMVVGASALAEFAHVVAARYPIHVALHTDHCPKDKLDTYMRPLVAISRERVQRGQEPLFQSHMWDGSAVPLKENLEIASELLEQCAAARIIMEMEIGVVGGEEDGDRRRDQREAVHHAGRRAGHRRGARAGRARPVHPGRDVRQRARRLQAGAREAAPDRAQGDPGRGGPEVRQGKAVRPRLPRRVRARPSRRSGRPSATAWSR